MLGGGGANLKASEEGLVTVLPHDEDTDGADESLGQVQQDLDQEVERERPGDHLAVTDSLVGEGAGYWVFFIQHAHAVLSNLLTAEVTSLWVVVSGERHNQHWNDQADHAQDKVEELWRVEDKSEVMHFYLESFHKKSALCLQLSEFFLS